MNVQDEIDRLFNKYSKITCDVDYEKDFERKIEILEKIIMKQQNEIYEISQKNDILQNFNN